MTRRLPDASELMAEQDRRVQEETLATRRKYSAFESARAFREAQSEQAEEPTPVEETPEATSIMDANVNDLSVEDILLRHEARKRGYELVQKSDEPPPVTETPQEAAMAEYRRVLAEPPTHEKFDRLRELRRVALPEGK